MEKFQFEDEFYPLMMRIYQAKYLMEEIRDYGFRYLPKAENEQRCYAYADLLYEVLGHIVEKAEAIDKGLNPITPPEAERSRYATAPATNL